MFEEKDMLEQITDLLMDNGCTVNKKAMQELVKWHLSEMILLVSNFSKKNTEVRERLHRELEQVL